jgi:hypothetical protein
VGLEQLPQLLDGGRIQSKTIPELGDEDPIDVVNFHGGLEHSRVSAAVCDQRRGGFMGERPFQ